MMASGLNMPEPSRYGISPKYGFLSAHHPLSQFSNRYYKPWDDIIPDLHRSISNNTLNKAVANLPHLTADKLDSDLDYRRAYVILAFLINASVWHTKPPNPEVPASLAEPFLDVCQYLRMEPVLSYAGLCSWNWQIINGGGMELENMTTIASFTGTRGEAAFYHVPVLIEWEGGYLVHLLLDAILAANEDTAENARTIVKDALDETSRALTKMAIHLPKFNATLDPHFFYHTHRPFMAGGKGMEAKGLPDGMVFHRSDGSTLPLKLVGGSAAQSSLFPFLDYALGVKHTGEASGPGGVFREMRDYMPGLHRDFLDECSKLPSLREYVETNLSDTELTQCYNTCMSQLRSWRGKHIASVSKYIVQPAREAERSSKVEKLEEKIPDGEEGEKEWELQGTGGSALIPFLRGSRDDTVGVTP